MALPYIRLCKLNYKYFLQSYLIGTDAVVLPYIRLCKLNYKYFPVIPNWYRCSGTTLYSDCVYLIINILQSYLIGTDAVVLPYIRLCILNYKIFCSHT